MAIMVWEMISSQLTSIFKHTIRMPGVPKEALHDHMAVFRAIKEHNPAKARSAMRAHLEHADRVWRIVHAQQESPEASDKAEAISPIQSKDGNKSH